MKRKEIIILVVIFVIAYISFELCMVGLLYPNVRSDYPTYIEFADEMKKYGCEVKIEEEIDGTSYFYETSSCDFDVKLIVFSNQKTRDKYYENFLNDVKDNGKIVGGETINVTVGTLMIGKDTNGENYKSLLLKEDSILYINTPLENRNQALQLKSDLGYKYEVNWNNIKYLMIPVGICMIGITYFVKKHRKNS